MCDLEVLELLSSGDNKDNVFHNPRDIQRFKTYDLNYNDFFWTYMENNWPVVLSDVSSDWECRTKWIKYDDKAELTDNHTDSCETINYDYLKQTIGNCQVPVANCNVKNFNSHAKSEMLFYDFLNYWQRKKTAESLSTAMGNTDETTTELLYLKDWHLKQLKPDYDFYKVPKHFASDWLNEHLIAEQTDDYRFVYMGPKNTWTPFHSDVFGSFSWSTNIMGIKKWLLLPPGEEIKLSDRLRNLPFRIDEELLNEHKVIYYTLMQKENESLFVPSGWYHQVWNETDTISINHNWFNSCNLKYIWLNLSQQMQRVINEIEDCRQMNNFIEHCQTMLRASFGINYLDFLHLLQTVTARRFGTFNNNTAEVANATANISHLPTTQRLSSNLIFFEHYKPNEYHIKHDLQRILQVVNLMLQDSIICDDRIFLYRNCIKLKEELMSTLTS